MPKGVGSVQLPFLILIQIEISKEIEDRNPVRGCGFLYAMKTDMLLFVFILTVRQTERTPQNMIQYIKS